MEEEKKYYKWTSIANGSVVVPRKNKFHCMYVPHMWLRSPIGGFFVFDSELNARSWWRYDAVNLWEVSVQEEIQMPFYIARFNEEFLFRNTRQANNIKKAWSRELEKDNAIGSPPVGTKTFKYIKLNKLVYVKV